MTIGILILLVFLAAAVLMFFRALPALLALPLMAAAIVLIEVAYGKLGPGDLARAVAADGAVRLADAMVISMFGGMLSVLMQKAGVAESFVRRGAELAGDNPWMVGAVMLAIITLLFSTIGGLGAVIMVGTIVLPILASMGVREHISSGILLFGISLGGLLNAGNWTVYRTVLGLDDATVFSYALVLFLCVAAVAAVFLTVELWRTRLLKPGRKTLLAAAAAVAAAVMAGVLLGRPAAPSAGGGSGELLRWTVGVLGAALLVSIVADLVRERGRPARVRWQAYLIPLVPLVLIVVYDLPFVAAFICGLLYGILAVHRRGIVNMTARAVIEGSAGVIPAIVLMIGIGMLLSAILGPTRTGPGKYWYDLAAPGGAGAVWPVLADMQPMLRAIVPESFGAYVLTFALLGPLALYRGPLNVWGLGYGVGGILLATGVPAGAVMGILMSLGTIQGVCDPTNTANVWVANEVRLDVTTIMWKTLPYAWGAAVLGLIVAGLRFMV